MTIGQFSGPGIGAGGGSGTVSANSGSAGAIAYYAAAGGSTTVSPDPALTDNGTQVVSTEPIAVPVGTVGAPGLTFAAHLTSGLFFNSTHGPIISHANTPMAVFDANQGVVVADGNSLLFSPNVDGSSADTAISRETTNALSIGAAEVAFIRSAGSGRVTSDVTLTVNTAITIFSFALPAIAKAWGWQAVIPWVISAGTGTNTLSIGVNYSQTPTATTGMQAEILTTNTGTGTQAFAALTNTGATNILTSGTITPGATVFQSSCSGTLLASATAGTFTITMTAAGTTATALAKAGATCWFY